MFHQHVFALTKKGLQIIDIHKSFDGKPALAGVSLQALPGEILAVLGPSGCGKSTLLHIIAGLEAPERGSVLWDGAGLAGTPAHRRGFGLMFQDYALFPHMSVFQNVAFGLQMAGLPLAEIQVRVAEALALVNLPEMAPRDVNTLSGGEQQRVALARALAPRPRLLMLDEPLGALDRALRERLLLELLAILRSLQQTAIYVTHDQEEAFSLADRVAVMEAGRIVQSGAPQDIYQRPATPFVARFLGMGNLIEGRVTSPGLVETALGVLPAAEAQPGTGLLLLRPDAAGLVAAEALPQPGCFRLQGLLSACSFRGSAWMVEVDVQGVALRFELPAGQTVCTAGQPVTLEFQAQQATQWYVDHCALS
jgi:ABC-type Fe3+/spermidine/putrescine transport system ATPase subunit